MLALCYWMVITNWQRIAEDQSVHWSRINFLNLREHDSGNGEPAVILFEWQRSWFGKLVAEALSLSLYVLEALIWREGAKQIVSQPVSERQADRQTMS